MCSYLMSAGRRRRNPEGTVMESSDSASWRRQTMRRRNSRLANEKKTTEARNARRGGKRDNLPAIRVKVASPKKSPIALSLGLYGNLWGSVISDGWPPNGLRLSGRAFQRSAPTACCAACGYAASSFFEIVEHAACRSLQICYATLQNNLNVTPSNIHLSFLEFLFLRLQILDE